MQTKGLIALVAAAIIVAAAAIVLSLGGTRNVADLDSGQVVLAGLGGKRRPDRLGSGADGLYIRRPGDAQSWLALGSVELPAETKDWLDRKIVSIAPSRIGTVTLTHPDGSTLVLKRDKEDGKFAVEG